MIDLLKAKLLGKTIEEIAAKTEHLDTPQQARDAIDKQHDDLIDEIIEHALIRADQEYDFQAIRWLEDHGYLKFPTRQP